MQTEKLKSEGKCLFCGNSFSKSQIHRHLQKHLADEVLHKQPGKSFLLKAEPNPDWGPSPYFLSLWVDGETKMEQLDDFLRQIWLECCGHMSSFTNPKKRNSRDFFDFFEAEELLEKGKVKEYEKVMEESRGEVPMSRKAKAALEKNLILIYQYDFGSTTELRVKVMHEFPVKAAAPLVLLSRNEAPEIFCEKCGKEAAVEICIVCYGYEAEGLFCKKCAKKHEKECDDFADYSAMPVVNSPRMGVCGYAGGSIDKNRDGIFKKQPAP